MIGDLLDLPGLRRLPLPARLAASPLLHALIGRRLATRDRAAWRAQGGDLPLTPVLDLAASRDEPQFRHRDLFDDQGWVRAPLPQAVHLTRPAPELGEHTAAILGELETGTRNEG